MTPKRFKAVCTETGAEETDISIVFQKESHKNLITYEGPYKIFSSKGILVKGMGWELCQSTGLTDAKGQGVYEGDVIMRKNGAARWEVYWNEKEAAFWRKANEYDYCPLGQMKDLFVIGNRWMPQAELQARAEAVSNG